STRTMISLQTKLRYTTMVILPDDEDILDIACGDKDYWVISASQHIVHIKPAKEGASTNLNVITANGNVYSFLLTEGKNAQPDLTVYVSRDSAVTPTLPKFVPAALLAVLEGETAAARKALETVRRECQEQIATFKRQYSTTLQFAYGTPKYTK